MNDDHGNPGSMPSDDLFDLPSETPASRGTAKPGSAQPALNLDAPSSALPRRPQSTSPAGPPISSVSSNAAAILEQVRKLPSRTPPAAAQAAAKPAKRRIAAPRPIWIAFGALALGNALILGFVLNRQSGTAEHAPAGTPGTAMSAGLLPVEPRIEHDQGTTAKADHAAATTSRTAPVLPEVPAHELARRALREAEADMASGRRAVARARLGRIGLTVDAIDAQHRDAVRAEIALLLARSIQDDADEASRSKR